jgi:hypothetical protein
VLARALGFLFAIAAEDGETVVEQLGLPVDIPCGEIGLVAIEQVAIEREDLVSRGLNMDAGIPLRVDFGRS